MDAQKTIIHYEEGKGLLIQGEVSRVMLCCAQILVRINVITGHSIDELAGGIVSTAKMMAEDERLTVMQEGKVIPTDKSVRS